MYKKQIGFFILIVLCIASVFACGQKEEKMEDTSSVMPEEQSSAATTEEILVSEEVTSEEDGTTETAKKGILIAIDPGHQGSDVDMSAQEPNAPGSSVMKTKATGGTSGRYSGVPEYQLNLDISLQLRDELARDGYDVILTRTDNNTAISNSERAMLANDAGADIAIRIHANGSEDSSVHGALVLIGSNDNPYVGHLYDDSYSLGKKVLDAYCSQTGMSNIGIQVNDTMTGINWSQIPVIILEMGFMTNQQDDLNMADPQYQKEMVRGIVNGINDYYGFEETENESKATAEINKTAEEVEELKGQIEALIASDKSYDAVASVYVENLSDGSYVDYSCGVMKAASLIKLYIAGCVYEQREVVQSHINSDEIDSLVVKMLSASDNDATNTLIKYLGDGDAQEGMNLVNVYCDKHGFNETSMGRMMLDFSSNKENYTSVSDCAAFLKKIYHGDLVGSDFILSSLKQQERTGKIPAGLPEGVLVANKTGELEDVENDVAIVFAEGKEYTISVMMNELTDTASARNLITELSALVYEYETS